MSRVPLIFMWRDMQYYLIQEILVSGWIIGAAHAQNQPRPWRFDVLTGCVTHTRESRCFAHYGTRKRLAENVSMSEISVDF
jgi:hypothetical protein